MKDIGGKFFGEKYRVGEKMNSWEMYNDNWGWEEGVEWLK